MKRTRLKDDKPTPLFPMERTRRVLNAGVKTLQDDVQDYMIPILREYGYDGRLVYADEVSKKHAPKEYEKFAKTSARDLLYSKEAGIFLEIWKQGRTRPKLIVKPFVRENLRAVRNLPRYNLRGAIAKMMMTNAVPEARIKAMMNSFFSLDLTFLIMTKTGMFWLGKYNSIPEDQYFLTWRKDRKTLDRIAVKNSYQDGKLHSCKQYLTEALKEEMFYFNKNNKYDCK